MKTTRLKMFKTAKEVEVFYYSTKPLGYDFTQIRRKTVKRQTDDATKLANRQRTILRSKAKLRRLINANVFQWANICGQRYRPLFLTLTFKDAMTDLKTANYELTKFIQRLNNHLGYKRCFLKYLVVPEIQKKREAKYGVGVWHFHLVIFNMPFVERVYDVLNKLWTNGFMLLKSLDKVNNIGNYISKYMSKSGADVRLIGNKAYFGSRNLKRPEELKDEHQIIKTLKTLPPDIVPFEKEYQDGYYGTIIYRKYQLPL